MVVAAAVVVVDFFIYSILRIVQYVFMFIVYVYVNVNVLVFLVRDSERNFEGVNIFTFLVYQGLPGSSYSLHRNSRLLGLAWLGTSRDLIQTQIFESDSSIKKQEQFTIYRPKIPNIKSQNNENLTNIGDKPLVKNCYSRTAVPGINTCLVLL